MCSTVEIQPADGPQPGDRDNHVPAPGSRGMRWCGRRRGGLRGHQAASILQCPLVTRSGRSLFSPGLRHVRRRRRVRGHADAREFTWALAFVAPPPKGSSRRRTHQGRAPPYPASSYWRGGQPDSAQPNAFNSNEPQAPGSGVSTARCGPPREVGRPRPESTVFGSVHPCHAARAGRRADRDRVRSVDREWPAQRPTTTPERGTPLSSLSST
jgi:hypothetical protein